MAVVLYWQLNSINFERGSNWRSSLEIGFNPERRTGKVLILRLTPRGLRRFRLDTTRSSRISSLANDNWKMTPCDNAKLTPPWLINWSSLPTNNLRFPNNLLNDILIAPVRRIGQRWRATWAPTQVAVRMGRVEHHPALAFPANLVAHKAINSTMTIFLLVFQTFPEPIAFPVTVDDIGFMSQAIQ